MSAAAVLFLAAALLSSCLSFSAGEDDALRITSLINNGETEKLTGITADTFLFNSEIIHGKSLAKLLWEGTAESGFSVKNAAVAEKRAFTAEDVSLFGDSREVRTFFMNYLPENSVLFTIAGDNCRFVLLLAPDSKNQMHIIAIGGIDG